MNHIKPFNINENNTNLAIYYFNPNDYGEQYSVLAESKESALEYVINYIKEEMKRWDNNYYDKWLEATVDSLPDGYTIDIFNIGQVIATELS